MFNRDELIEALRTHVLAVTFTKADGTRRRMLCTLKEGHLPPKTETADRSEQRSLDAVSVWDIEKNDWRAFRVDYVLEVEGV